MGSVDGFGPGGALRWQEGLPTDAVVVMTTAPDELLGKRIAHLLVEESLVACAQVGARSTSMFLWQGRLEGGPEVPLTLKTTLEHLPALHARLVALHPYDLPEFLVIPVLAGSTAYLDWVEDNVDQVALPCVPVPDRQA